MPKCGYTADLLLTIGVVTFIQNVNLLTRFGELEALADFHFLFDGVILQPLDALFLLHVFAENLLVLLLVRGNLTPLGKQRRDAGGTLQRNERISNTAQN